MCAPVVAGALVASAAVRAYSGYQQGKAEQGMALNNAALAEGQAAAVRQQGASDASTVLAQGRSAAASTYASSAASGVVGSSGSAGNMFDASLVASAADAARIKAAAARQAWGYEAEAQDQRYKAKHAKRQGILLAFGAGLEGGAGAVSAYAKEK